MQETVRGFKAFTHDFCSPIQEGPPVWDGSFPYTLPPVKVDQGPSDCAPGWNFCTDLVTALRIAGFWPNGHPVMAVEIESVGPAIQRGEKWRGPSLKLLRPVSEEEIAIAIRQFSTQCFSELAEEMAQEQLAWRRAFSRPKRDPQAVEAGLRQALAIRGLPQWRLKRFALAKDAKDAKDARDAWDARVAWDARGAWGARDAWDARVAWGAWDARGAWGAWDAWGAWGALSVFFTAKKGWTRFQPHLLTTGLREAYENGLALAIPTGSSELGWAMSEP